MKKKREREKSKKPNKNKLSTLTTFIAIRYVSTLLQLGVLDVCKKRKRLTYMPPGQYIKILNFPFPELRKRESMICHAKWSWKLIMGCKLSTD